MTSSVVLVPGGGTGIGALPCRQLAKAGDQVVICGRTGHRASRQSIAAHQDVHVIGETCQENRGLPR